MTSLGFFGLGSGLHFFGFLWAWFRSSLLFGLGSGYFWVSWFRSSLLLGFFGLGSGLHFFGFLWAWLRSSLLWVSLGLVEVFTSLGFFGLG